MELKTLCLLILGFGTLSSCAKTDTMDQILPSMLKRMKEVLEVLLPLPKHDVDEAMYNLGSYYIPIDSETELCRNHSSFMFDAFLSSEIWALKMVDASSKGGAGVMDGNIMDLGNYDQCISTVAPADLFTGQLCIIETKGILPTELTGPLNPDRPVTVGLRADLVFSMCVPSTCTAQDVKSHMDVALNSVNATSIIYNSSCSSSTPIPLEKTDYLAIFVLLCIAVLVILSTRYDSVVDEPNKNELLTCFSISRNIYHLLGPEKGQNTITCLHGLRVFAISWIILGHRFFHVLSTPMFRLKDISERVDSVYWAPVQEVQLAVEIFFVMSGLLVTHNYLNDREKGKSFNYAEFALSRYQRLTPALAVVVMLYATLIIHIGNGPMWTRIFTVHQDMCQETWWASLTYLSNFLNSFPCVLQTWYLSADFQLHMISPLFLYFLHKSPRKGVILLLLAMVCSITAAICNALVWEAPGAATSFQFSRKNEGDYYAGYVQTQYRASSFIMGGVLGWIIFKVKQEQLLEKMSKNLVWTGWIASICMMTASVFCVVIFLDSDHKYNPWVDSPYYVLHRYTFTLGVCWIILSCHLGYGGMVNRFLSWSALVPLSRLSYCVFLLHYVFQEMQSLTTRTSMSINTLHIVYLFAADFMVSFVLSIVLYLAVEAPFNNLFKVMKPHLKC